MLTPMPGLEPSNATVRWTVAADGLTAANLNLRSKMQTRNSILPTA